jgi:hypothetical protein
MRIKQLAFGLVWALLLLATNAHAFVVTADSATVYVGDTVTLRLSGAATDVTMLSVGITPDSTYLGYVDPSLNFLATPSSATAGSGAFDATSTPPLLYLLLSDAFTAAGDFQPFSMADGPILEVSFLALSPTDPGFTTVSFDICATANTCDPAEIGFTPSLLRSIDINILQRNSVPEPATLWLAVAAFVAGSLVFGWKASRS